MGNIAKFAALNSKVKVLSGKLLKPIDYERMLQAESFEEAVEYLIEDTRYKELLDGIEAGSTDRKTLETALQNSYFKELERLYKFMPDLHRTFFATIFMRYEVENIKVMIRALGQNESLSEVVSRLFIHHSSKLPYDVLSNCRDLTELIEALKGTIYYRVLSSYLNETPARMRFYMEMSLDRIYFEKLKNAVKQLDHEESTQVGIQVSMNIDLLNLQWIYRGRRFYQLSPEELVNYALIGGKYFNFEALKKLCYASTISELVELIKASRYGLLIGDAENFETYMERSMERSMYQSFMAQKVKNNMNIVEVLAYMHQMEFEIRDIFSILEMKRYGIYGDDGKEFLVKIL